ncbi:MAG: protein phosphatase 2C domain-containing protein, partial [Patescibacteria group bacterium]
ILKRIVEQQISNFRMARTSRPSARAVVEKETKQMVEEAIECDPEIAQKALALLKAMRDTNEYVQETNGMTTACIGLVHEAKDGSRWAIIANVGDSAALKRNKDGDMIQLTQEDSFIEYVKTVSKKKVMNNKGEVVPLLEAMKKTPRKKFDVFPTFGKINYLQLKATVKICLGSREFEPSITIQRVNPGDEIIFATDGVIDKYDDIKTDETDLAALGKDTAPGATLVERINNLRRAAKKRSVIYKNDDDVAIVAARILER